LYVLQKKKICQSFAQSISFKTKFCFGMKAWNSTCDKDSHLKVLGFSEKLAKKLMQSFFFQFKLEFILMDIITLRLNLTYMIRTKYDY
jgi:hypothetical protein